MKIRGHKSNEKEFVMSYVLDEKEYQGRMIQIDEQINHVKKVVEHHQRQLALLEEEKLELTKLQKA